MKSSFFHSAINVIAKNLLQHFYILLEELLQAMLVTFKGRINVQETYRKRLR